MLAQSVGAMTIKCSCVLAGHGRPITSESSVTPLFIQQPYARDSAFAIVYGCFSRIKKKKLGRLRCELVRGSTSVGYDQFETSPEAIEQELRPAICERRPTDRLKANYSIDDLL